MNSGRSTVKLVSVAGALVLWLFGGPAALLAGANLDLRPDPKVPVGGYAPHTIVKVHVFLVNTGDPLGTVPLRAFFFDVTDTSPGLTLQEVESGMCCCSTYFEWTVECTAWCIVCPPPNDLSWVCPLATPNPWCNLYWQSGNTDLGYFEVDVGTQGGRLDVVNADEPDSNQGARLVFGYGGPGDPITIWRAYSGELTGGVIELPVNQGIAPAIVDSDPPNDAIDARQPLCGDWLPCGWSEVELAFDGVVAGMQPLDFEVTEEGGTGEAPAVASVEAIGEQTLRVIMTGIIEPGAWTTIRHTPSDTSVRLGFLPGDANGDGMSSPVDILALIDSLNGVVSRPIWSTDIDRSGLATPADILRLIDLLNGAGVFYPWNGVSLP